MGVPSIPLGGVDVTICLGKETVTQHCRVLDNDTFDIVIGTDFLRRNPEVKMLSLQRPYSLHCDLGSGLFSVPLKLVYPMGYWTDLFYGEQFAEHNTNSVDHSLNLSKSFMISPYREP